MQYQQWNIVQALFMNKEHDNFFWETQQTNE